MAKPLDKHTVKAEARGRWQEIFDSLGIDINPRLYSRKPGSKNGRCPAPGCGKRFWLSGREDAWRESGATACAKCGSRGDGIKLVQDVLRISFPAAIEQVAGVLGLASSAPAVRPRPKQRSAQVKRQCDPATATARRALKAAYTVSVPAGQLGSELIDKYLAHRGLYMTDDCLHDLWYAPQLKHYADQDADENPIDPVTSFWPGMLATFRDPCGNSITAHRTYLTPDGVKAPVIDGNPKKLMSACVPSITGGAVRLTGDLLSETLNLTEGIETALAVFAMLGFDHNVWSCLSAALLAGFEPPAGVNRLVVWADKDRSHAGQEAADTLRERMQERGIEVEIQLPPLDIPDGEKSVDWLDAWNAGYRLTEEEDKLKGLRDTVAI